MIIIKDWFKYDNDSEVFIAKDEKENKIYKFVKCINKVSKDIIIGKIMEHSEHYLTPNIIFSNSDESVYLLEYYNGRNFISDGETHLYEDDMIEAHKDAVKAGLNPSFGYDDVMIDDKDNLIVVNLSKFRLGDNDE
ncbi:hypothetical protein LMHOCYYV_CDS0048 [Staphylococcus phage PG-2021_4]